MQDKKTITRREGVKALGGLTYVSLLPPPGSSAAFPAQKAHRDRVAADQPAQSPRLELFSLDGKANILEVPVVLTTKG